MRRMPGSGPSISALREACACKFPTPNSPRQAAPPNGITGSSSLCGVICALGIAKLQRRRFRLYPINVYQTEDRDDRGLVLAIVGDRFQKDAEQNIVQMI